MKILVLALLKLKTIYQGQFVYSQLTDFLPKRIFDGLVSKYDGNKYVRHFSYWNQLMCMVFGQLTGRDSLRDLIVSIEPHKPKFYHIGFGKGTSRSIFANANEKRDCRIFEDYAYYLIDIARKSSITDPDFQLDIDGKVYAFDSTTIDMSECMDSALPSFEQKPGTVNPYSCCL